MSLVNLWNSCNPGRWQPRIKAVYDNLRIKQKLFLLQALIVFIFGTVCLTGIQIALSLYDGLLYNEAAKVLNLSTVNIENELKQVESVSYSLLSHPDIQQYLKKLQTPLGTPERAQIGGKLTELLWVYVFEKNIDSVNLLDGQGNQYSGGAAIRRELLGPIIAQAASRQGSVTLIEPLQNDRALICTRQIREIRDLSLKPLGTLIIRVNMAALVRQSTAGEVNRSGELLIRSGDKEIYASDPLVRELGQRLKFHGNSGYRMERIAGRSFFVAHTFSPNNGWEYVNILPYDTIFQPVIMMRTIIVAILGLLLVGVVFVSLQTARSLTRPIENLSKQMKRVETGDFTIDAQSLPEIGRSDEIGDLQRDFAIMIQKINTLIQEDYTKQIVIKDTQFRALQTQINPHFLYNTMESINWLAKLHGEREISQMVEALGSLLRNAISNRQPVIPLGQELALLQSYIYIQQVRFGERLQFALEVDPQWRDLVIPKLTLQPIVENSIRYGLETITGVCEIRVKAEAGTDWLELSVSDNGPGIDPARKEQVLQGAVKSGGNGIGLQNIDQRLRLSFGDAFGLVLESRPGLGTTVRVRIPRQELANG